MSFGGPFAKATRRRTGRRPSRIPQDAGIIGIVAMANDSWPHRRMHMQRPSSVRPPCFHLLRTARSGSASSGIGIK
ncbi:hypothetical protein Shel_16360 [Slackia heliotrinireducens DSM 20476]|uniref:Uncharacterized protein n=1 Tax=Slackia heliotrinireducens (strain ATCC 29202 / DSM 20476 / NCTC 11029 / RHS 1) TaxID=471855 RepID=C7N6X0_SLAHD|nr:hypothetical protein Shel_16360 [Slackia heliotrinireducens DSM 20476]